MLSRLVFWNLRLQCSNEYTSVINQDINVIFVLADNLHVVKHNTELYRTISYYKYVLLNIFYAYFIKIRISRWTPTMFKLIYLGD